MRGRGAKEAPEASPQRQLGTSCRCGHTVADTHTLTHSHNLMALAAADDIVNDVIAGADIVIDK